MKNKFQKLLKEKDFVFLDGAMGTMIQAKGIKIGEMPEILSLTEPESIMEIHRAYIDAGSDIVYANTFGANRYKLEGSGYTVNDIIPKAIENAQKAAEGTNALVALDIGPIGVLLEPTGTLPFEEAYDIYKEEILAGKDADIIVFETMTDLYEVRAAVLAARENSDKPILVTMTFEENMRTFTGCSPEAMALTLSDFGVDAIGVNCSLGPDALAPIVERMSKYTSLPLIIKPNAGLPDPATGKYDVSPDDFSSQLLNMTGLGIKFVGGCCGTTPDFIRSTVEKLKKATYTPQKSQKLSAVCSAVNTLIIDRPRIIGERINPTGKKRFKQALLENDMDYIISQAIEQVGGGAEILDVNVGLPNIDEKEMMVKAVKAIQSVVDVPLQLDSTIPEVLEAGLRVYNGKPIINSVNGEEKSLETILPLAKKYGAMIIGLTIDKDGIPPKAEQRFKIAEKIAKAALDIGIPKENICIDCLCLTASAEQAAVMETVNAIEMVKKELKVKTVLGVSNISFGLPARELINSTFLTVAMTKGLDLAIINPNVASMTGAIKAYRLLANQDVNSEDFIATYSEASAPTQNTAPQTAEHTLSYAIEKGMKNEAALITEKLLTEISAMEIINEHIIPALDKIGSEFEKGKIFLPQLILSANVSQQAFEVIKKELVKSDNAPVNKGKIVIATVKGDVHDIGKNIVKVLLENYGYDVIDLGKDVEYQAVVDAVKEHDCKLVGLSALMTTTLVSMEKTIALIRENGLDCKVMVGGAVLTEDYAEKIGADFYSKDAKESVDIAKRVLG